MLISKKKPATLTFVNEHMRKSTSANASTHACIHAHTNTRTYTRTFHKNAHATMILDCSCLMPCCTIVTVDVADKWVWFVQCACNLN